MKHNEITKQAAQKVISKIDTMGSVGLFKEGYASWSVTRTKAKSFEERKRLRPDTFHGVWDINATITALMDELAYMGIR